jgi:putative acetyltransferase
MHVAIQVADTRERLADAHALFLSYQESLGISLCFQGFGEELATLPGRYSSPAGRLYVAYDGALAVACVAMRPQGDGACEMKRLFVTPAARGHGLARRLVDRIVEDARGLGYTCMRLDTLPSMAEAQALYVAMGFRDIAPYTDNPVQGARFMELTL